MSAASVALIQYVGKQPRKRDNVRDSGREWPGPGSVLEVPLAEKHSYLAHPGEWQEITTEQLALQKQAADQSRTVAQELGDLIQQMDEGSLTEILDVVQRALHARRSTAAARAGTPPPPPLAPVEPPQAKDEPPAVAPEQKQSADRVDQIVRVVRELDPKNPEHYTKNGLPRVGVVEEILKYDVTADEVEAAHLAVHPAKD